MAKSSQKRNGARWYRSNKLTQLVMVDGWNRYKVHITNSECSLTEWLVNVASNAFVPIHKHVIRMPKWCCWDLHGVELRHCDIMAVFLNIECKSIITGMLTNWMSIWVGGFVKSISV